MVFLIYLLAFIGLVIYLYIKWKQSYWQRKGVEHVEPNFFFGNVDDSNVITPKVHRSEVYKNFYYYFKNKGLKYGGLYNLLTPVFVPVDLDLIKSIIQTDFSHFVNHDGFINEEANPLHGNLFSLRDDKWRRMRSKLTPTFTSGKMRMMFDNLTECSHSLEQLLNENTASKDPIDIKEMMSRFTTDVISSVAFGVEAKSLKDPNSVFRKIGRKIFESKRSSLQRLKVLLTELVPEWFLKIINLKTGRSELERFFIGWVKNLVEYREKNNVIKKDFFQLLIQLRNTNEVSDDGKLQKDLKAPQQFLSIEEMTAQAFVFFTAGFETSASTTSFLLMNLALNQDIQDKTREEILRVLSKNNNQLSYEAIMEMEYLDQVLSESIRLTGVTSVIRRVCNADYKVPNSDLIIDKGTLIRIPVVGLHHDPEHFPNPEKFDPDRFNLENKQKIPQYAYMPFGEGPRLCIGLRFGKLQTKVGLVTILKNFKVTMSNKTKLPINIEPQGFIPSVDGGLWLNLERI